jgi:glycosyltransferase involved in cell wall biosynthesis
METVVRTLAGVMGGEDMRIFCSEGADDHGLPGVEVLPAGRGRRRALIERLSVFQPRIIEHHQQVKQAVAVASAMPDAAHILYRHNALKTPRNGFDAWRYNRRYAAMDGFVFVSEAERALFSDAHPHLADRAWAVPNPIEIEPWLKAPEHREPVIAFAGRAMPEKGVDIICAALPAVLDRNPEWRAVLMLADWERHRHWAAPHVAALDRYGDRVTVLRSAPLSTVQRQMQTASIALMPSIWAEPFGLAAIEAHAAGAALISSGRGGLREASGPHAL